jgi:hypothetical protein
MQFCSDTAEPTRFVATEPGTKQGQASNARNRDQLRSTDSGCAWWIWGKQYTALVMWIGCRPNTSVTATLTCLVMWIRGREFEIGHNSGAKWIAETPLFPLQNGDLFWVEARTSRIDCELSMNHVLQPVKWASPFPAAEWLRLIMSPHDSAPYLHEDYCISFISTGRGRPSQDKADARPTMSTLLAVRLARSDCGAVTIVTTKA